ncbi:hypothetical protein BDV29DRAFT_168354 [Aspergillus leporis]|uniref:Uncharacterized protein n=1 Tax=Aspergillus leporis TaxID=41062 RepID=A0A5N5X9L3_9EURO|nr:hypothetical protein BDV29DRAFT_168354 [Aspergillus leporis]
MRPLRASTSSLRLPLRPSRITPTTPIWFLRPRSSASRLPKHIGLTRLAHFTNLSQVPKRTLATTTPSGKTQPDLIVEELQELYETAKDEFEIATDSTKGSTIYAASDRESARDALNQLLAVFSLYTTEVPSYEESHQPQQTQPDDGGSQMVSTYFDPAEITPESREEVKRRVGQRVRELENAVADLEERAKED